MIVPLPPPANVSAGLLLNGFVCTVVAFVALSFSIFLLRRWSRLAPEMKAYTWFWIVTIFAWSGIAARYYMYVAGVAEESWYWADQRFFQTAIYSSGMPLLVYLALLLFKKRIVAWSFGALGLAGTLGAAWWLFQPDGFSLAPLTDFTVDPIVNIRSIIIFDVLAAFIMLLLIFHIARSIYSHHRDPSQPIPFAMWYSLSLLIYVGIGSVDQSKIITGWPIVAFRVLYAAAFLFAYLITARDEARREQYLLPVGATTKV
jgi:hypothetical protein